MITNRGAKCPRRPSLANAGRRASAIIWPGGIGGEPGSAHRDGRFAMAGSTTLEKTVAGDEALIRRGYEAFSRGDVEGALAVFADDILWHVPGRGPLSRDYHGPQEVLGFCQHFMELSQGTFRIRIDDVLAKDGKVVVLC